MVEPEPTITGRVLIAAAIAFVLTAVLIGAIAFYSRTAPPASQFPITVAIIALIGTLWTGAITLAGLLLKDAVDRRNGLLQAESEKRLRMETALKAIELTSVAEAEGRSLTESREAAILVISSLGHLKLAYRMAEQFWLRDKISAGAFVQIVDEVMSAADRGLKEEAAYVVRQNAARLVISRDSIEFPDIGCMPKIPAAATESLILALAELTVSREQSFWDADMLAWVVWALWAIIAGAADSKYRYRAALFALRMIPVLEASGASGVLPADGPEITYNEMRSGAQALIDSASEHDRKLGSTDHSILGRLESWAAGDVPAGPSINIRASANAVGAKPPHPTPPAD
jgi:hypothetical protein